ncbi:tetratricopeptide repeat protein [Spongisporangium articulatum]|uniref:Tetratricopeptide repeat protein n=1 Tax=Spongisporangium articulatum TaxID=3362603 RepID=A0ABW8APH6_9ACTN
MAYRAERFPGARRMLAQDVVGRYDLKRTLMARQVSEHPGLMMLQLFGDVELDDLDLDPRYGMDAPLAALNRSAESDVHGLVIAGNLLVNGAIHHVKAPAGLSLYVLGDLKARNVAISGLELVVRGTLTVTEVFSGSGPAGGARLDGGANGKLLISDGFPMLIGGTLGLPVLDTGRTRIGLVENGGVREVVGDVPAPLVLNEQLLPAAESSLDQVNAVLAAGGSVLSSDYLAGRTDLEVIRQLRWLEREIEKSLAGGHYLLAIDLLRAARMRGAPRRENGLLLADAIFKAHYETGEVDALAEALAVLNETLGRHADPELARTRPTALVQRAMILHTLHEDEDWAFDQAWRDCSDAIGTLPPAERIGIAKLMGEWLFNRHRYEECVPYLQEALANDPGDGVMYGRMARALWMLDREEEALPYASRSLQLNPVDDRMWFVRGTCRRALGQLGEAALDLQTYLELHPDDVAAVEAAVEVALGQGRQEVAIERAGRFIDDFPEITDSSARFGRLFRQQGLVERALPFLRRAVEIDPEDRSGVRDLAVTLVDAGRDHAGLTTALRSLEIDPDGDHVAYLRAECLLALGEDDAAAADLETYLAHFPDAARAQASLAMIRLRQGRTEEAEQLLGLAWSIAPDDHFVEEVAATAGVEPPGEPRQYRSPSHVSY